MKRAIGVLAILGACCWTAAAQDAPDQEERNPARENPILREYFRARLRGESVFQSDPNWEERLRNDRDAPSDPFLEKLIDRQIDHFIEGIEKEMEEVRSNLEALRALTTRQPHDATRKSFLKKYLTRVADGLGSLRKNLRNVLRGLPRSKAKPSDSVHEGVWESSLAQLERDFREARRRIIDYLLKPNHTVNIDDLTGKNMLATLSRAEKTARLLRKSL